MVIDEVGKMELFSKSFRELVRELAKDPKVSLLATIPIRDVHPLVKELRRLPDAVLIELRKEQQGRHARRGLETFNVKLKPCINTCSEVSLTLMKRSFRVEGMTCVNCARTIEIALKRKEGVKDVEVSFELGRVKVDFDRSRLSEEDIVRTIESLGYRVLEEESPRTDLYVLLFSGFSALAITLLMFYPVPKVTYFQFLLSTTVQFVGGWKFYSGAYNSLQERVLQEWTFWYPSGPRVHTFTASSPYSTSFPEIPSLRRTPS
ncbi:MAG: cation transporter [Aquificota bacterium]|nr:cation transporter [Aquificota bacterium]